MQYVLLLHKHTVTIWIFTSHKKSGRFQTTLQTKPIHFLIWKNKQIRSCQIQWFLQTVDAIPKMLNHLRHIFASNCNSSMYFNSTQRIIVKRNFLTFISNLGTVWVRVMWVMEFQKQQQTNLFLSMARQFCYEI